MSNESNPNQKPARQKPGSSRGARHAACARAEADRAGALPSPALVIVLLVFAALATFGILSRIHHNSVLADTTQEAAAPAVIALPPKPGSAC